MEPILSDPIREALRDALGDAQRIGMLGQGSIDDVIERSLGFVRRISTGSQSVIDLGSGGGDPGLAIALACPTIEVTLVDRRAKRTDVLVRLVGRLGLTDRVEVVEADVANIPALFPGRVWDVATSRGFGSPTYTADHAAPLIRLHGCLLVSEPPESTGERWMDEDVRRTGLLLDSVQFGVAKLVKTP